MDGSHHAWLEDRGPTCGLMAYIDDASSRVEARFYTQEGTVPALDSFGRYVRRYGVPLGAYADQHTTYRAPGEPTVTDRWAGTKPPSQFERAPAELGVQLIQAHSPQAKGRVDRWFQTRQDRLVKALRAAGIATIEAANQVWETGRPRANQRVAVSPAAAADLHRPSPTARALAHILCVKTTRVVRRDWTGAHHGQLDQLETTVRTRPVVVEERLDGTLRITHRGQRLTAHALVARPVPVPAPRPAVPPRRAVKPTPTHSWRQRVVPTRRLPAPAPRR